MESISILVAKSRHNPLWAFEIALIELADSIWDNDWKLLFLGKQTAPNEGNFRLVHLAAWLLYLLIAKIAADETHFEKCHKSINPSVTCSLWIGVDRITPTTICRLRDFCLDAKPFIFCSVWVSYHGFDSALTGASMPPCCDTKMPFYILPSFVFWDEKRKLWGGIVCCR